MSYAFRKRASVSYKEELPSPSPSRRHRFMNNDCFSDEQEDDDWSLEEEEGTVTMKKKSLQKKLKENVRNNKSNETTNEAPSESAYELLRKKNIEVQKEMLRALGFAVRNETEEYDGEFPQPPPRKRRPKPEKVETPPLSCTLRKRNGFNKVEVQVKEEEEDEDDYVDEEEENERPAGPQEMVPVDQEDKEVCHEFMSSLLPHLTKSEALVMKRNLDSFKMSLKELQLTPDRAKKVGTCRTTSMTIHPTDSKILVVAGDVMGNLGFWDVNRRDGNEIQLLKPCNKAIFCTSFCKYNAAHLYSTCIDGTVLRGDINHLMFDSIYGSDINMKLNHTTWHCQQSPFVLLVAHGNGCVAIVDTRCDSNAVQMYKCHGRSVRTVHVHPLRDTYFTTSSKTNVVGIWDARQIQKKAPKAVHEMIHPKPLKSSFFSPNGSFLLTNCIDNKIRIYDTLNFEISKPHVVMSANHSNDTGRWLTPFKAHWHPQRNDAFVIGSLDKPRSVKVIGIHGMVLHKVSSPNLQTVLSCCQFHPTQQVLAGANNSGKVHVFTSPQLLD